jgi:hypothetical protein
MAATVHQLFNQSTACTDDMAVISEQSKFTVGLYYAAFDATLI